MKPGPQKKKEAGLPTTLKRSPIFIAILGLRRTDKLVNKQCRYSQVLFSPTHALFHTTMY